MSVIVLFYNLISIPNLKNKGHVYKFKVSAKIFPARFCLASPPMNFLVQDPLSLRKATQNLRENAIGTLNMLLAYFLLKKHYPVSSFYLPSSRKAPLLKELLPSHFSVNQIKFFAIQINFFASCYTFIFSATVKTE